MYCPKCGTENPATGKFCRKCGTDLGSVSEAISGKLNNKNKLEKHRKGKTGWESALGSLSMGVAFVTIAFILGFTDVGRGWWFWMLIPGFGMIGAGVSKIIAMKQAEKEMIPIVLRDPSKQVSSIEKEALPPKQTDFVSNLPDGKYETGELAPPSVVENTTKLLELDKDGETMTLPKNKL